MIYPYEFFFKKIKLSKKNRTTQPGNKILSFCFFFLTEKRKEKERKDLKLIICSEWKADPKNKKENKREENRREEKRRKKGVPLSRGLKRAEIEIQTLLTGKIILCHQSINLLAFLLALIFLLHPTTSLTAPLFIPAARPFP